MIWARKKTGEPVVRLNSVSEAEAFAKKYSMFVVGLFEDFEVFFLLLHYSNYVGIFLVWGILSIITSIGKFDLFMMCFSVVIVNVLVLFIMFGVGLIDKKVGNFCFNVV